MTAHLAPSDRMASTVVDSIPMSGRV